MMLCLHLFEPLMGNILLTLNTCNYRNQFLLKCGISRLDNGFFCKKKTHETKCHKNGSCDNRTEKSQLPV